MKQDQTTIAERNEFIDLKLAGNTLTEIADKTGWSFYCVRHWWRQYREGRREALVSEDKRKRRGKLSKFPGIVRFAMLRVKKEHPGWGAPVVQLQDAKDLNLAGEEMPSVSAIEKYWAQYKWRLYKHHRERHPTRKSEPKSKPETPHERWQADFKVKMQVPGIGKVDVFNVRAQSKLAVTCVHQAIGMIAGFKMPCEKHLHAGDCVIVSKPIETPIWSV